MIPTYHCAAYLRETLESVLAQDPGPERMQIEVVDDHSTADDPEAVVRELGGGPRHLPPPAPERRPCRRTSTRASAGLARATSSTCSTATTPSSAGFYETMARPFAQDPGVGAAFCRYVGIDEQSRRQSISPLEALHAGRVPHWLERIALGQRLQVVCMVVRRDAYERVGGFAAWPFAEDWEMWVRLAAHVPVWYEPQPLARYRVHAASMTNDYLRTAENARAVAADHGRERAVLPSRHGAAHHAPRDPDQRADRRPPGPPVPRPRRPGRDVGAAA